MRESLKDKMEYHNSAIRSLEQKIAILQKRIDAAYIDKIDGRIPETFWKDQSDKWLKEKEDTASKLLVYCLINDWSYSFALYGNGEPCSQGGSFRGSACSGRASP